MEPLACENSLMLSGSHAGPKNQAQPRPAATFARRFGFLIGALEAQT